MTSTLVGRLCEMPRVYRLRRDVPLMGLLRDIGLPAPFKISEREIEEHLRLHPELIDEWVIYSEDQRCSPAWYLARPAAGRDGAEGWAVGFYALRKRKQVPDRVFPDKFSACAFFIARHVEQLGM